MKSIRYLLIPAILAGGLCPLAGQPTLRQGRSCIELSIGLWRGDYATSQVATGNVSATASGLSGAISYWYGLRDQLFLGVSAAVIRAEANNSSGLLGTSQEANAVVPLQFGVRYWFFQPEEDGASLVPFVQASLGPVFGFVARNTLLVQEARTETAIGGRISAGADLFTSRTFSIGLRAGFLLMADFAQAVGARRNFSGPDFSLGGTFFWGAGRTTRAGD